MMTKVEIVRHLEELLDAQRNFYNECFDPETKTIRPRGHPHRARALLRLKRAQIKISEIVETKGEGY